MIRGFSPLIGQSLEPHLPRVASTVREEFGGPSLEWDPLSKEENPLIKPRNIAEEAIASMGAMYAAFNSPQSPERISDFSPLTGDSLATEYPKQPQSKNDSYLIVARVLRSAVTGVTASHALSPKSLSEKSK
jgi:hypothetical protein